MKDELEIHESLFNNILNGIKTQTIRLGNIKMTNKFKFISSCSKKEINVTLISLYLTKYNIDMNLSKYYPNISTSDYVTVINFKRI